MDPKNDRLVSQQYDKHANFLQQVKTTLQTHLVNMLESS